MRHHDLDAIEGLLNGILLALVFFWGPLVILVWRWLNR